MRTKMKAQKMVANSAMTRKGPSQKNITVGAKSQPKPSMPAGVGKALKGPTK